MRAIDGKKNGSTRNVISLFLYAFVVTPIFVLPVARRETNGIRTARINKCRWSDSYYKNEPWQNEECEISRCTDVCLYNRVILLNLHGLDRQRLSFFFLTFYCALFYILSLFLLSFITFYNFFNVEVDNFLIFFSMNVCYATIQICIFAFGYFSIGWFFLHHISITEPLFY